MKLKILNSNLKPFKNRDGIEQDYWWYKAERLSDETVISFGSTNGDHETGEVLDLYLEKKEGLDKDGNTRTLYKEVTV